MSRDPVIVVISSPLEPELVEQIRRVDTILEVLYDPQLLATPRYAGDHAGDFNPLTPEQSRRWHGMLARAHVSFDFDRREPDRAHLNFPALQWVQATSAGLGQVIPRFSLDLDRVVVTTAAGVHAEPLSEFVIAALLYFVKGIPHLRRWQGKHQWTRYTSENLSGKRVLVIGLGHVGRASARKLSSLGVDVVGAARPGGTRGAPGVSSVVDFSSAMDVVGTVDAVVLACPLTPETEGLVSAQFLASMRPGALLVNIARGQVVDENALIAALRAERLGGAALDVATTEPLPPDSPLWDLDNVLISPHSASTVREENQLITDLFCTNLRRWLDGMPLFNVYQPENGY